MTDHTLNRLRAANPFPAATTADADALFDRIVLPPPDRRLDRTPLRRRRPTLVLVAAALVVGGLLASGAYGISSLLGTTIDGPTVKAEYAKAQTQLTLPPGYTWPALHWPANSVTSLGAGGSFAVSNAQDDWECYWVDAIHSGDVAAQHRAQAALADLMQNHAMTAPVGASENWSPPNAEDTPMLVFARDGGYQYKQRMYADAAAGKPQLLEQSCKANGPASHG
ncbi:MAG TPA: hypothetical protein VJ814_02915 [Gaiellaceae bacterium]|nr:hypothetical protein [Gaiellaceae bacterium]